MGGCGGKLQRESSYTNIDHDLDIEIEPNTSQSTNSSLSNEDINDSQDIGKGGNKINNPKLFLPKQIVGHGHDIETTPNHEIIKNSNICSPLFCDNIKKKMHQIHEENKTEINEKQIERINEMIVDYYSCYCLRNLFPNIRYNQYSIHQIEPIIVMFLIRLCPDGILPTLQFDDKECLDLNHLMMRIDSIDCHSVNISLHNYPQINYRIFYKVTDELNESEWQYQDIDETATSRSRSSHHFETEPSSTNTHYEPFSIQTDWIKSPRCFKIIPIPILSTINRLKMNTSYQVCLAPKFTKKLLKESLTAKTKIMSTSTTNRKILFEEKEKEEENIDEHEKKMNFYGIVSEIAYFKTTNWRFDAGTVAKGIDGVLFHHKNIETDTVGGSRGYDVGIHKFKIEFVNDMNNGGMHYCAFGVVSHHFFNNAMSDTHWIAGHDKNYYYLTEYGYLCRKDKTRNDCDDIGIKWKDEQDECGKTILTMNLDLNNWRLSYIIGKTEIDSISIEKNEKYYVCISGRKGNFSVKILSQ